MSSSGKHRKNNVLVIGIGNMFRCDDGVGLCVIEDLQKDPEITGVDFMMMKPDGYSLIEAWDSRELVIVVDAAMSGGPTGTIRRFEAFSESIPYNLSPLSTHAISLTEAIKLAETLDQLPERMIIYAIEIGDVSHGDELSPEVGEAGKKVTQKIKQELQAESEGTSEVH